ncbi:MAG: hypothetical protein CTY31_09320 [Hyphomicrobium sp.]|nr:MAG: hypothetical protein CTY39_01670 [Hyphomicrobium sp.]PPD00080.1 MAG: hypothetical protein CTY31_09320 [Hyphomicrobium sp.]
MSDTLASSSVADYNLVSRPSEKGVAHALSLFAVWLTIAISALVFMEPAPVDLLTMGLMVLLPVVGLTRLDPKLLFGFSIWLIIFALGIVSAAVSRDAPTATVHMFVSLYLYGACFLFASFVAKNPEAHTKLILNGYLVASVGAACIGIAGYLDLFPGAFDHFTRYGRATSTFKDPNVFGPFLVCGLLTSLHLWLSKPLRAGLVLILPATLIMLGIFFSFSRGAWAAATLACSIYGFLYLVTAKKNNQRVKLIALFLLAAFVAVLSIMVALQSDKIAQMLEERAVLAQSYDTGVDGRFGGQNKAIEILIDNPLGIGALTFFRFYHPENVHNIYLNMFLSTTWLGGLLYLIVCLGTLVFGFQHALKSRKTQPLFLIVYSALAANIALGVIIDTDHWRHYYLLMGVVWGLMASDRMAPMEARRTSRILSPQLNVASIEGLSLTDTHHRGRILNRLSQPILSVPTMCRGRIVRRLQRRAKRLIVKHVTASHR